MNTQRDDAPAVLITGASSGIGAATARALAAQGMTVHATARREQRLIGLAEETGCEPHVLDVRDAAAVQSLIAEIGTVDILVNNAGLGRGWGPLVDASYADIEITVATNVTAAIHLVQAVLPAMIAQGAGHIVNVGSMAGLYPLSSALYGATKGAMHRLSTNLRLELQGTGVRVTEICPGRIQTEFYQVAVDDPGKRAAILDTGAVEITAAECADTIVYAINAAPHVNINRIELQPTEQTYGGSQYTLRRTDV
jgi:3-hydroxy acid dehydrogenase/malonic semialdehyde reductase